MSQNGTLKEEERTQDSDWILLCNDCKTSGTYDTMIKKHKNHSHIVTRNPESDRWK